MKRMKNAGSPASKQQQRKGVRRVSGRALSDEEMGGVSGGHGHAVTVPGAAAPKVFDLVASGKAPGLNSATLRK